MQQAPTAHGMGAKRRDAPFILILPTQNIPSEQQPLDIVPHCLIQPYFPSMLYTKVHLKKIESVSSPFNRTAPQQRREQQLLYGNVPQTVMR